jgi:hypothetical protein
MIVRVAPNLDSLRSEPRFTALLERSCRVQAAPNSAIRPR